MKSQKLSTAVLLLLPGLPWGGFVTVSEPSILPLLAIGGIVTDHKHSGLKITTPVQRYTGEAEVILKHRKQVYRAARARHPNRWSGDIRNWDLPVKVWLNPEKERSDFNEAA